MKKTIQTINVPIRKATLDDFHTNRRKHVGMVYLLINENGKAELYRLKEDTVSEMLIPFIEKGRCYILASVSDVCYELELVEKEVEWVKEGVAVENNV